MTDLQTRLARRCRETDDHAWTPVLFRLAAPEDREGFERLLHDGQVAFCHDRIEEQLGELIETRHPEQKLSPEQLHRAVGEHLGGMAPCEYGTWVYYPWSRRLAHALPEAEYAELRTSRNRNKITAEEQQKLSRLRLGVAGLSVGQATAVTLTLEGLGGELRLADFDRLSLSNMNRLRAGIEDVGVHKTVLTAREIYRINPYARVRVFTDGVTDENIERFLTEGGPLDMLFEECDDLYIKILLREHARRLGIPVLMESSDRGLVDIERFDLEPDRPILHGLVGGVDAASLKGLDTYRKVPIVLRILGDISPRMAASLVEIEETLKTWPQLASDVAQGGALNTHAARRVALGELQASGRFHADMEQALDPGRREFDLAALPAAHSDAPEPLSSTIWPKPARWSASVEPCLEEVRGLVAHAAMAPSGGNCQPWRFEWDGKTLRCFHDRERSISFLDFEHAASHLALGAAAENLVLAAAAAGWRARVTPFAEGAERCAWAASFEPGGIPERDPLAEAIVRRCTNRRLGPAAGLDPDHLRALCAAVQVTGADLVVIEERDELDALGAVLGIGDRLRLLDRRMHREMMTEIRWSPAEAESTRDGLDLATLELTHTDAAAMRLASRWPVMELVSKVGGGRALEKISRKAVAASSALVLLTMDGTGPGSFLAGGRAVQRLWLAATAAGVSVQPMAPLPYLFARLERGGEGLSQEQCAALRDLRKRYLDVVPVRPGSAEVLLLRLAYTDPPTGRSLRRHVDDVLTVTPGARPAGITALEAPRGRA